MMSLHDHNLAATCSDIRPYMVRIEYAFPIAAALLACGTTAAAAALGPDAPVCNGGRPAVLVSVNGFKARTGNLRVQLYGPDPKAFLAHGGRLRRIDVPVTAAGPMSVCVAVPHPGTYAIAVRHDVNGDDARHDWTDGGGFSNNPHLSLLHLKPSLGEAAIGVGGGVKAIGVTLLYRHGFSIGPEGRD
ncbi:MAG TPA: DUF2141 domain-containing protein [Allosphingosinicella sp.]|jgi:uncharacterized protein (DUF2141 family)